MFTVVSVEDAARLALAFPEVAEGERHGNRTWAVRDTGFAWVRPFSKADVRRFGDAPVPPGPIVAVYVADLAEKEAVLAAGRPGLFTIPHFKGFPAVLIDLATVSEQHLREALEDGWLARAPAGLVEEYLSASR